MKSTIIFLTAFVFTISVFIDDAQAQSRQRKQKSTVQDILNKYKEEDRGGAVRINKFTRLIPDAQMPTTRQVRNVRAVKPPNSMQFFIKGNEKEAQLERLIDDQIEELYSLSQKFRKSPERGEIWLRLGEVYVEKAKMVQYRIQTELDKKLADWEAKGKKGQAPKVNADAPLVFNKKAIQLYEWYANDFPKSKKLDQAFFFLGYNYVEVGQFKKGTNYYERLTKQFPKSAYVTESYFALGEYYFENSSWKKAIPNYKSVLRDPSSRIYPFAMYKLAWSHYRSGQPAIAIGYLEKVIELSSNPNFAEDRQGKQVNKIRLVDEAVNDLILFYPEARAYQDAPSYFENIGGSEKLYSNLEKLAYLYSDRGQREAARYVFNHLIEMKPNDAKNFDFQNQIVVNYFSGGSRQTFRQELFNWISNYGEESEWARANSKEVARANEVRESTLKNYILQEHKALQKSRAPLGQKLTKNTYELYIKEFPNSKNIAEMRFFYGELLYDMGEYDKASEQYNWVIENAPNSQYHSVAVLNQLLALERSLPSDKEIEKIRGASLEPFEMNKEEKEFIAAGTDYVNKFPKADKVADIKFKIGRIYYSHNYFDQALSSFRAIMKEHPKTPFAKYSANLILDIYNLRKDYEGLTKAGEEILTSPDIKSSDITMDVQDVVEKARFREAQDLETSKNYLGSAKAFEAFSKAYPSSKLANIGKYNAAVNYERAGEISKSTQLYSGFLVGGKRNENEKQRKEARRLLGRIYERTGQLEKAAEEFEKFTVENPKDPLTPDLYYNMAVIYAGFKNYTKAIRSYERFYETSKKANRVDAIYLIGDLYEKRGSLTTANRYFERFIGENPRDMKLVISASYRVAKNAEKLNQPSKSEEWFKKIVALRKRAGGDLGARESAEGQFNFTLRTFNELKSIRIPANPAQQGPAVQQKLALLNRLNQELLQVVKLDVGDYVVASLSVAGQAYDHMSQSIYTAPIPKGMSAEDTQKYMAEVEKIAGPLKKQAIDNYKNSIQKARQIDVYNKWVITAREALNKLEKLDFISEDVIEAGSFSKVNL